MKTGRYTQNPRLRVNKCKRDVSTAMVERGFVGDIFASRIPFIRQQSRVGQSLSEDTETCIHEPYRKLDR
jgi:hypothetical protein